MYTIVIIEPRKHKALNYIIRNALDNLDEYWSILIFHGTKNKEYLDKIVEGLTEGYKKRISFRDLGVDNLDYPAYAALKTSIDFYKSLPTEICLFMETDSMIISRNKNNIYYFLEYDYVGAPWSGELHNPSSTNGVGNGGFSLRRRSAMISVLESYPYTPSPGGEDCHISKFVTNKPPLDKACAFAMESIPCWDSFGLHKPWNYIQLQYIVQVVPNIQELIDLQGVED